MKMVKDGFHSHLTIYPAEHNKAANSLRKWINGLRKTAQGGPFLLSETWRQRIKQDTATRFVYDENLHGSGVVAVESLIEISCAMITTVTTTTSTSGAAIGSYLTMGSASLTTTLAVE